MGAIQLSLNITISGWTKSLSFQFPKDIPELVKSPKDRDPISPVYDDPTTKYWGQLDTVLY